MYLEIVEVTGEVDSSGIGYKKVGFAPLTFLPNGKQVLATGRIRYRNVWPDAERDVNGVKTLIKGDLLFETAAKGEVVEGQIATFGTKGTYSIDGTNQLSSVTVVAFKGESPAVLAANQAGIAVLDGDEVVQPTKKRTTQPNTLVGG